MKPELRIFISQLMNGRSDKDILVERKLIEEEIKNIYGEFFEVKFIDNFNKSEEDKAKGRLWMLGNSIQMMREADIAVFGPNFHKGNGCMVEYEVCEQYNIPIRTVIYTDINDHYVNSIWNDTIYINKPWNKRDVPYPAARFFE